MEGLIHGGAYFRNFTVFHYKGNKYCDSVNSTKLIDLKLYAFLQTSTWKIFACRGWKSLERFLHLYQETQHDLISWYFSRLASESSLLGDKEFTFFSFPLAIATIMTSLV